MAEIAICSLVRDGMDYLPSYRRQIESLQLKGGDSWRLYILEGDSRDASHAFLQTWASEDPRVRIGQEHVGDAMEQEDRAARWARVGNACFDLIPPDSTHTHVLWLEADLCFPPELLHRLVSHEVDILAPMIYLGGVFYDTWGFRDLKGQKWNNLAPFHPDFRPFDLMEMGSVGSCVLFQREVLDAGIRFKGTYEDGLLVGMCQDARAKGFKVYADTGTAILHPMGPWEAQMWRPSEITIELSDGSTTPLSIQEARVHGLELNLPLLDGAGFLKSQARFLLAMLRRFGTTRLELDIRASVYPAKRYRLRIKVLPPIGLSAWSATRRILLKATRARRMTQHSRGDGELEGLWARGQVRCRVKISMENHP